MPRCGHLTAEQLQLSEAQFELFKMLLKVRPETLPPLRQYVGACATAMNLSWMDDRVLCVAFYLWITGDGAPGFPRGYVQPTKKFLQGLLDRQTLLDELEARHRRDRWAA